jgi:hypothetical protein
MAEPVESEPNAKDPEADLLLACRLNRGELRY